VAQGRAKPVDWLVQDLYGLGEDEGGQEFRNDEADDSEEEREELRRQVKGGKGFMDTLLRGIEQQLTTELRLSALHTSPVWGHERHRIIVMG
jgi:hypothetical protein